MNVQEFFSPENTAHLLTEQERKMHTENAIQYAWLEKQPDITETEFTARSQWFREAFLASEESLELVNQFQSSSEEVLAILEQRYLASVTKH